MSTQSARLQYAVKTLRDRWELARETWDDQAARDFEKQHLYPIESLSENAILGMDKLAEVLSKIRRACEE
jgi:hypothetical protein